MMTVALMAAGEQQEKERGGGCPVGVCVRSRAKIEGLDLVSSYPTLCRFDFFFGVS